MQINLDTNFKQFWDKQSNSLHRYGDDLFYKRKAKEHLSLMTTAEKNKAFLDLGCGAGELLEFLCQHVNVVTGLDYSEKMLSSARERLAGLSVNLTSEDLMSYLPNSKENIWMTTGAINQYLEFEELKKVLSIFNQNVEVETFFLFDCVDPIKYFFLPFGLRYQLSESISDSKSRVSLRNAYRFYRRASLAIKFTLGNYTNHTIKLPEEVMGYAHAPVIWHIFAQEMGLKCEIVSSLFYEYRYHVALRKVLN